MVDGARISYRHLGFESVYEIETFLSIDTGRLISTRVEHHEPPAGEAGVRPETAYGARGTLSRDDL